jgi:hypothetical protein
MVLRWMPIVTGRSCEECGAAVEFSVVQGPDGPFVMSVCAPCALVRVPVHGPAAEEVLSRWRNERISRLT